MVTAKELAARLGVSHQQISAWVRSGLPKTGDQFVPEHVADWLVEQGKADLPDPDDIVHTNIDDAAAAQNVNSRTFREWMKRPGFPGIPSRPGIPGHYHQGEIRRWRDAQPDRRGRAGYSAYSEELARIKMERAALALQKERGELVHVEEMERFMLRTNSHVITRLSELKHRVDAMLPEDLPPQVRTTVLGVAQDTVDECRHLIAELLEGDRDGEFHAEEAEPESGKAMEGREADSA